MIEKSLVRLVNLLFLLKSGPKHTQELIDSQSFCSIRDFKRALRTAQKSGLICVEEMEFLYFEPHSKQRRHQRRWWRLTSLGLDFLHCYDNEHRRWIPQQTVEARTQ